MQIQCILESNTTRITNSILQERSYATVHNNHLAVANTIICTETSIYSVLLQFHHTLYDKKATLIVMKYKLYRTNVLHDKLTEEVEELEN